MEIDVFKENIFPIAAVYVLYEPDESSLLKSLEFIRNQVDYIILIDNSEKTTVDFDKNDKKIYYVKNEENLGIAKALNTGCNFAIELNANWVLTLDQDSTPSKTLISELCSVVYGNMDNNVAAVGPKFKFFENEIVEVEAITNEVDTLITSGCLMNLSAYKKVGGFKESLFIDSVDIEFCFNLRKNGYKIFQNNGVLLSHNIGNSAFHVKLFGKKIMTVTNHNYIRQYYIARNSLKVFSEYKEIFPKEAKKLKYRWLKQVVSVIFFEKNKLKKIKSIFLGIKDYKRGIYGKYSY